MGLMSERRSSFGTERQACVRCCTVGNMALKDRAALDRLDAVSFDPIPPPRKRDDDTSILLWAAFFSKWKAKYTK
jgi:hypothetical protein